MQTVFAKKMGLHDHNHCDPHPSVDAPALTQVGAFTRSGSSPTCKAIACFACHGTAHLVAISHVSLRPRQRAWTVSATRSSFRPGFDSAQLHIPNGRMRHRPTST
ncbi:unnamed protein product [Mycena citricolor]|uniref:Uncharacterized protein n=1 Tax=Mycena citricolor TaxID=2018698 RepID=A0AAD2HNH7_9AGAR|nr:unnamed protein product [Mycena citricolor]